jgi:predicted amidohydrolase
MPRKVRIATVAQLNVGGPTVEHNRERMCALTGQAAAERPDIICLPETFLHQRVDFEELSQVAEPIPGPTTDAVAGYARAHHCYIICPLVGIHGDRYMNDAVLIDRQGQIAGIYSKVHPWAESSQFTTLERGITPGSGLPVFETDFGCIGIQICFDIWFAEDWAELKRRGAEIVFWSSAFDGGKHLGIHAWNQHYYVVSAVKSCYSRIIDVMGDVLAMTGPRDPVIAQTIDLDVGFGQIPLIRAKYGPDVTIRMWHQEGVFTIESNQENLTVADIAQEFKLDPFDDYLARNAQLQDAWREGKPIPDLTPDYVGRLHWA